jgi:hypothetical protein
MMTFKGTEAHDILKTKNGGLEFLQEYLEEPTIIPKDISSIFRSSH